MRAPSAAGVARALGLGLLLAGCSASRIENGTFYSPKGYQVRLPGDGWRVDSGGEADLQLRRDTPPGGMLTDATCEGRPLARPLPLLLRYLTFGLARRTTVESATGDIAGQPAASAVVHGTTVDGQEVAVEAIVVKTARCVHDFLYVAPTAAFDAGRGEFRAFAESLAGSAR
jgi:hypothetical protein